MLLRVGLSLEFQALWASLGFRARSSGFQGSARSSEVFWPVPIGPIVVPFWGSYLESYKVITRRNYYGAYG